MTYTEYAVLGDEDIISFTLAQEHSTNLETELAQRFAVLVDLVQDLTTKLELSLITATKTEIAIQKFVRAGIYGDDTRSKSKALS